MRTFLAALVVLPYSPARRQPSGARSRPTPSSAAGHDRPTTPGSPPAASSASCRSPRSTSRTTPTSPSTRASNSSTEDTRRGMSRGTNHSTREATRDTGREQKAQVGRRKALGDHEIYRPPEAGAQVRILPGAPRLTCGYYGQRPDSLSGLAVSWNQSWNEFIPRTAPRRSCSWHRRQLTVSRSQPFPQLSGLPSQCARSRRSRVRSGGARFCRGGAPRELGDPLASTSPEVGYATLRPSLGVEL